MLKNVLLSILAVIFLLCGLTFSLNYLTNTATSYAVFGLPEDIVISEELKTHLAKICSSHGGINCSVINSEASVVCNDGTIDESFPTIYGIPQCYETIENLANQRSDFMAESGCYPPSEMACINNQSYQNLYKSLVASNLLNSELGKDELVQCKQDIVAYQAKNEDYKQCLAENNNPQLDLSSDKATLPILKAVFCPFFYGENSFYNDITEMCGCDSGYFMTNGQCTHESLICQSKYGANASAQNGNCILPSNTHEQLSSIPTIPPKNNSELPKIFLPTPNPTEYLSPEITTGPNQTREEPTILAEKPKTNFFQNIINSVISSIRNIFKLF